MISKLVSMFQSLDSSDFWTFLKFLWSITAKGKCQFPFLNSSNWTRESKVYLSKDIKMAGSSFWETIHMIMLLFQLQIKKGPLKTLLSKPVLLSVTSHNLILLIQDHIKHTFKQSWACWHCILTSNHLKVLPCATFDLS